MVTSDEREWLSAAQPGLVPGNGNIAGVVQFTATYNPDVNLFSILNIEDADDVGGVKLVCRYQLRIVEREIGGCFALPAVYVDGIEPVPDRHFRADGSACLCSPLEEKDFCSPTLEFRRFLEHLVIPFLYGQSFYSEYKRWPWKEYAHNSTGLLESFADCGPTTTEETEKLLRFLAADRKSWPGIKAALLRDKAKGHISCFCPKGDHIRRCHPRALDGLRRLHKLVKEQAISLPPG